MAKATLKTIKKEIPVTTTKVVEVPNTVTLTLSLEEAIAVTSILGHCYGNLIWSTFDRLCDVVPNLKKTNLTRSGNWLKDEEIIKEKAKEMRGEE